MVDSEDAPVALMSGLVIDTGATLEGEQDPWLSPEIYAPMQDDDFGVCVDMDAPAQTKSKRKYGGLRSGRFRRRSMQDYVTGDGGNADMEQLTLMNEWWDEVSQGAQEINREQLEQILKANYTPSQAEVNAVLEWLDVSEDGLVSFDEYCVGMAKVCERANITAEDGVAAATSAMADGLAALLSAESNVAVANVGNFQETPVEFMRMPSKVQYCDEKTTEASKERLGPELLEWLKEHFDAVDTETTGQLKTAQVELLVMATYAPRGQHLQRFMKWFAHAINLETNMITKEDYLDSMVKLQSDLNYKLSPSPSPKALELMSPKSVRRHAPSIELEM